MRDSWKYGIRCGAVVWFLCVVASGLALHTGQVTPHAVSLTTIASVLLAVLSLSLLKKRRCRQVYSARVNTSRRLREKLQLAFFFACLPIGILAFHSIIVRFLLYSPNSPHFASIPNLQADDDTLVVLSALAAADCFAQRSTRRESTTPFTPADLASRRESTTPFTPADLASRRESTTPFTPADLASRRLQGFGLPDQHAPPISRSILLPLHFGGSKSGPARSGTASPSAPSPAASAAADADVVAFFWGAVVEGLGGMTGPSSRDKLEVFGSLLRLCAAFRRVLHSAASEVAKDDGSRGRRFAIVAVVHVGGRLSRRRGVWEREVERKLVTVQQEEHIPNCELQVGTLKKAQLVQPLCVEILLLPSGTALEDFITASTQRGSATGILPSPLFSRLGAVGSAALVALPRSSSLLLGPLLCRSSRCHAARVLVFSPSPASVLLGSRVDYAAHAPPSSTAMPGLVGSLNAFADVLSQVEHARITCSGSNEAAPSVRPRDGHAVCTSELRELGLVSVVGAVGLRRVVSGAYNPDASRSATPSDSSPQSDQDWAAIDGLQCCERAMPHSVPRSTLDSMKRRCCTERMSSKVHFSCSSSCGEEFVVASAGWIGSFSSKSRLSQRAVAAAVFERVHSAVKPASTSTAWRKLSSSIKETMASLRRKSASLGHVSDAQSPATVALLPRLAGERSSAVSVAELTRVVAVGVGTPSAFTFEHNQIIPDNLSDHMEFASSGIKASAAKFGTLGSFGSEPFAILSSDFEKVFPLAVDLTINAISVSAVDGIEEDIAHPSRPVEVEDLPTLGSLLRATSHRWRTPASSIWFGGGLALSLAAWYHGLVAATGGVFSYAPAASWECAEKLTSRFGAVFDDAFSLSGAIGFSQHGQHTAVAHLPDGSIAHALLYTIVMEERMIALYDRSTRMFDISEIARSSLCWSILFGLLGDGASVIDPSLYTYCELKCLSSSVHYIDNFAPRARRSSSLVVHYVAADACTGLAMDAAGLMQVLDSVALLSTGVSGNYLCPGYPLHLRMLFWLASRDRHIAPLRTKLLNFTELVAGKAFAACELNFNFSPAPVKSVLSELTEIDGVEVWEDEEMPSPVGKGEDSSISWPSSWWYQFLTSFIRIPKSDDSSSVPGGCSISTSGLSFIPRALYPYLVPTLWGEMINPFRMVVLHSVPYHWPESPQDVLKPSAHLVVGRIMYESTRIPRWWTAHMKGVSRIWTPSPSSREALVAAGLRHDSIDLVPICLEGSDHHALSAGTLSFLTGPSSNRLLELRRLNWRFAELPAVWPPFGEAPSRILLSVFRWEFRKGWDRLVSAYAEEFCSDAVHPLLILLTYDTETSSPRDASRFRRLILKQLQNNSNLASCLWQRKYGDGHAGVASIDMNSDLPPILIITENLREDDLRELFLVADVIVAPSRGEGWGMPSFRAMSMEKVSIVTNFSGFLAFSDTAQGAFYAHDDNGTTSFNISIQDMRVSCEQNFARNVLSETSTETSTKWYEYARFLARRDVDRLPLSTLPLPGHDLCTPVALLVSCHLEAAVINGQRSGHWCTPIGSALQRALRFSVNATWAEAIGKSAAQCVFCVFVFLALHYISRVMYAYALPSTIQVRADIFKGEGNS